MKKAWVAAALAVLLLAGCTPASEQLPNQSGTPSVSGGDNTPAPESPVPPVESGADPIQTTSALPVSVREVPLNIPLNENEEFRILDIAESRILIAVDENLNREQGLDKTRALLIYDMASGEVLSRTDISEDIYAFYGLLLESDFVYSALDVVDLITFSGSVRRVGEHPWEYPIVCALVDENAVPMPAALPSGDVVFIDCGRLYYDESVFTKPLPETSSVGMDVVVVDETGAARTVFSPDPDDYTGHPGLTPYGDGYAFALSLTQGEGCELYKVSDDGVEQILSLSDYHDFPSWIAENGRILTTVPYSDAERGQVTKRSVLMTEQGEVLDVGRQYDQYVSDSRGNIAATGLHETPYILRIEDDAVVETVIDLPEQPMDLFCDGEGRLYACVTFYSSENTARQLYEILTRSGDSVA